MRSRDFMIATDVRPDGECVAPGDLESGPTPPLRKPLCIVGIGASAGGLDALESFFDNLPDDTGMAFVVIQHLSPDFRSMMAELLGRHTRLPVQLVEDGVRVAPDHVYLLPPGKEMIISGGRLLLSERDKQQELSLPIDVFFRSLGQDCGPRAAAIVLSGVGSDGSRGVRSIHEAGGLVVVQDIRTAQFDGMPKMARDAGVAHSVVPPRDMPRVLLEYANTSLRAQPGSGADRPLAAAPQGIHAIYAMLEREFGLDFTHYKPSTVTRRIERRLALARSEDIGRYVERLKKERDELDVLYRDLLIGVTRFFRNEEAFAALEQEVLPDLLRRGARDVPFRAWIAGCATGEEAYSMAITLHEAAARSGARSIKIFATDVHHGSLERAARGIYDEDILSNVSPDRLERYFRKSGRTFQVVPEIRQMIVFAPQNVIKDAPFTRVDLVSCRNLLIYLQPAAQQKALSLFHFALNRGGILFLGPSESPGHLADDYETIDKRWRIYRKYSDVRVPVDSRLQHTTAIQARAAALKQKPPAGGSLGHLLGTYDALLDQFVPPSFLVDDRGELVHAFAGASRFLKPHDGRQCLDILDQVDAELKMVLVGGIKRALSEHSPIVFKGVHIGAGEDHAPRRVVIQRVIGRTAGPPHVLVSLLPMDENVAGSRRASGTEFNLDQLSTAQLGALEAELSSTKENLQAAIEELEASNEELQAANEELLASNEELQSTNEELQSVNEELYTVNAEHQRQISELTELTNDMDNLLSSTEVGTIFLDGQLKIRKFTPQIAQTFKLVVHDIGRPIDAFTHTMDHPELMEDLRRCLASGERVERELRDVGGKSFFLRILPYRTGHGVRPSGATGALDGVVLTLIDVTGLKAAEDALFHERYLLNSLLASVPDAIYFKDVSGKFIRANRAMGARLRLAHPRDAVGKTASEIVDDEWARADSVSDDAVIRSGEPQNYTLEKRSRPGQGEEWDLVTRLPLKDPDERVVGMIGICRDVTQEKRAEERIQEAVRRRDQFLAMLSHELRNPLGAMVTAVKLLRKPDLAEDKRESCVATLDRQSGQMTRLLDDLLDASRVTQNKIELRKRMLDLRDVARDAADAVRGMIESRGLDFRVEADADPVYVDGDPARLQQIHVNLLSNAAKYTPRGGHVTLRIGRENCEAVVHVADDGAGIAADMLDSVFDLFVQSDRTLDRADGGLGVGLMLVRALVGMHGGSVIAQSDGPGMGSDFVVRLPLAIAPPPSTVPRSSPRPTPAPGTRVVVIEDNEDSRQMLCALLEQAGFECKAADSGSAGLALIDEMRPDIALIDVGLPEMDGLAVARRVRATAHLDGIYLIALTGYGQPADRAAVRKAGFDGHLVKPVDPDQLLQYLSGAKPEPQLN